MKLLLLITLIATLLASTGVNSQELHFNERNSSYTYILNSQYIAVIDESEKSKVNFYTKNQDLVRAVSLDWEVNHAWTLNHGRLLAASLKRAPDPDAFNQMVLFNKDKVIEKFYNVADVVTVPGGDYFAIIGEMNSSNHTPVRIYDKKGKLVKSGILPRGTSYRSIFISPDLKQLAVSPFSTDSSSVRDIDVYYGKEFSEKTNYSFGGADIFQTIPIADGVVVINVDYRLVALNKNESKWVIPNREFMFTVQKVKPGTDSEYIILQENIGRVAVVNTEGEVVFDSNSDLEAAVSEIVANGARIDVVNDKLVINDTEKGDLLMVPLKGHNKEKRIQAEGQIISVDVESGLYAFRANGKLKIKKIN
ncbi:hypothetical protein [Idiomarina sp. HP20-50]|uniref:hypothetical protein n=1 Tax=Idiomarina sp. HP20-50 TaxID=3070813 RepID=UPI00294B1C3F|nr:hypothetical protein [Idiomarina sp. HP20-50]MDV6315212.1 hypothetical protein [Idiomarina sp. HP20-50]